MESMDTYNGPVSVPTIRRISSIERLEHQAAELRHRFEAIEKALATLKEHPELAVIMEGFSNL